MSPKVLVLLSLLTAQIVLADTNPVEFSYRADVKRSMTDGKNGSFEHDFTIMETLKVPQSATGTATATDGQVVVSETDNDVQVVADVCNSNLQFPVGTMSIQLLDRTTGQVLATASDSILAEAYGTVDGKCLGKIPDITSEGYVQKPLQPLNFAVPLYRDIHQFQMKFQLPSRPGQTFTMGVSTTSEVNGSLKSLPGHQYEFANPVPPDSLQVQMILDALDQGYWGTDDTLITVPRIIP